MSTIEMKLQAGPNPTSIGVRIKNLSLRSVCVAAPNPYNSVLLFDNNRQPYPPVRAVAWEHSRKTAQIQPSEELIVTIDLLHYWEDICAVTFVQVRFEVTDDSGVLQDHVVEGHVFLTIPSFEEKCAELKRRPKLRGLPLKLFDVSDSTQFEQMPPQ